MTNEDGSCEIPRTPSFKLAWNGFDGEYRALNPEANRFDVVLSFEQLDTIIDETWLIEDEHLYVEFGGSFDKTFSFKRVPNKIAQKLFPVIPQTKSKK
ncbi:MAG: hypothetical protein KF756_05390 [Acidobacteria bacterium]|nr:hypothetical protein [Acidobacteriota bacterium]